MPLSRYPKTAAGTLQWLIAAAMLVMLPLVGVVLDGKDARDYLAFPPLTQQVVHASFSWGVFWLYAAIDASGLAMLAYLLFRGHGRQSSPTVRPRKKMPAWGWLGGIILAGGWCLAWTRFDWFETFQSHTFCLPWIGYILLVNALCVKNSGHSLLTDHPTRFVLLIIASTLFWWFFEYLNRFVGNWYYVGVEEFSPLAYALFASLAFATVLPAVLSTYRLLLTLTVFDQGLAARAPLRWPWPRLTATAALAAAAGGLALIGVYPDTLFALLWISPVLIISALQTLTGRRTIFAPLEMGDWRPIVTAATAGLICGFFWELWNVNSLSRWAYAIPYVDRFHLFAMPVLGYGGYLPFGLECLMIGRFVVGDRPLLLDLSTSAADTRPMQRV